MFLRRNCILPIYYMFWADTLSISRYHRREGRTWKIQNV